MGGYAYVCVFILYIYHITYKQADIWFFWTFRILGRQKGKAFDSSQQITYCLRGKPSWTVEKKTRNPSAEVNSS